MRRLFAALGIGMAGMAAAEDGYYGKYETPVYEVVQTVGTAELRSYAPHLVAVVTVQGDRRGSLNRGFRELAGYIFGGNQGSQSVDMTSPVGQTPAQIDMTSPVSQSGTDGVWEVTFTMPRAYTTDSLPRPNSEAVRFEEVPARRMLVLQFSGRAGTSVLNERQTELVRIAQAAGISLDGPPVFSFYDDPFTAPWARRNEVGFVIE